MGKKANGNPAGGYKAIYVGCIISAQDFHEQNLGGPLKNPGIEDISILVEIRVGLNGHEEVIVPSTRTQLLSDLKSEYGNAKAKYAQATATLDLQKQLAAAATILNDQPFADRLRNDIATKGAAADNAAAAKLAAAEAKYYSSYKAFADKDATDLAMLNNRIYWKKGTLHKFSFGGADAEKNYPSKYIDTIFGQLPNTDRVELPFMMLVIHSWTTETRFVSTIAMTQGVYDLIVETKGMTDWIQQHYPSGFLYCRGYFEVIETAPHLVLRPVMLGGLGPWDIEKATGLIYDDIVRKGIGK